VCELPSLLSLAIQVTIKNFGIFVIAYRYLIKESWKTLWLVYLISFIPFLLIYLLICINLLAIVSNQMLIVGYNLACQMKATWSLGVCLSCQDDQLEDNCCFLK
jgi:hypothetical protein